MLTLFVTLLFVGGFAVSMATIVDTVLPSLGKIQAALSGRGVGDVSYEPNPPRLTGVRQARPAVSVMEWRVAA